jgi:hypothetical protein
MFASQAARTACGGFDLHGLRLIRGLQRQMAIELA